MVSEKTFNAGKEKLENYILTGHKLNVKHRPNLYACRVGNSLFFYEGCELVYEFGSEDWDLNLHTATTWLFAGAGDPIQFIKWYLPSLEWAV